MFRNLPNRSCTIFFFSPKLVWQVALKKAEVTLKLLVDIDMLLKVEKRIRGGICQSINRYAKSNNEYMEVLNDKFYHILIISSYKKTQ